MRPRLRILALLGSIIAVMTGTQAVALAPLRAAEPVVQFGDGTQHEYRLIYTDYKKGDTRQFPIPQPPLGLTYTDATLHPDSRTGRPAWGVLLRSDGRLVGVGAQGREIVAGVEKEFPDGGIVDFLSVSPKGFYLVFADGTVRATASQVAAGWGLPKTPPGVRFSGFVKGNDGDGLIALLRADGKVTLYAPDYFKDGYEFAVTTKIGGYVGGTFGLVMDPDGKFGYMALLRSNGRVHTYDFVRILNVAGDSEAADREVYSRKYQVPKLPRGMRYVSVSGYSSNSLVYLRSDGRLIYKGREDENVTRRPQPPQPPAGLTYTSVTNLQATARLMRSDGQVIDLDKRYVWKGNPVEPAKVPKLAKGWRFLETRAGKHTTAFLVEKIPVGEKVLSGVASVTAPKSTRKGNTAKLKAKVASRAVLDGGIVRVTHKGKVIGQAKAKGSTATIKIKTKTFKKKGKNTIGVQYLGNYQAKKSVKAKVVLTTS